MLFVLNYLVPTDFVTNLQLYTKQGLRVIAAAYKSLNANTKWKEADDMPRLELEQKCEFLGLIIMQNSVKEETYGAIKELHDADINTVMVTGLKYETEDGFMENLMSNGFFLYL